MTANFRCGVLPTTQVPKVKLLWSVVSMVRRIHWLASGGGGEVPRERHRDDDGDTLLVHIVTDGQRHRAGDRADDHIHFLAFDEPPDLEQPDVGLELVVLLDQLELAPTGSGSHLGQRQLDAPSEILSRPGPDAGVGRQQPDLHRRPRPLRRSGEGKGDEDREHKCRPSEAPHGEPPAQAFYRLMPDGTTSP
jgi:hypothetical protein